MTAGPITTDRWWRLIEQRATATPDRVMLGDERGREYTFEDYRRTCEEVAAGLAAMGVTVGKRVSWQLPTNLEAAVLMGALSRLGAVQNPIIQILRHSEVDFIVGQIGAEVLVVPGMWRGFDHAAMAKEISATRGCEVIVVDHTECGPDDLALPKGDPATLPPFPEDPLPDGDMRWIYFSSGTTAAPKGAKHTDASVMAGSNGSCEHIEFDENDVFCLGYPITHIGGHTMMTSQFRVGMRIFLIEVFDPVRSPVVMAEQGSTLLGSAVPFFLAYLEAQRVHGSEKLYPRLRACPSGGAPSPPELHYRLKRELGGVGTVQGWGLTEFPVAATAKIGMTDEELALTNGPAARDVKIRVVTIDGREVGAGEEGELRVDGPQKLLGYVDSSLDADAFDEQGYFRTGDLGIVDAKGNVTITGRLKDIIIRNAENISAVEVENCVFTHPAVSDVGVIGLPDPRTGERAVAVVVLNEGFEALTLKDIADHCRAQGLSNQKIPEQLELVEVLPRNPQGKMLKHKIRELVVNGETTPAGGR